MVLSEATAELLVHAAVTVEVPPRSTLQVGGKIAETAEGTWLLEEATGKQLLFAVARALVEPTSPTVPLCILNASEDPVTVYAGMEVVSGGELTDAHLEKQEVLWDLVESSGADLSSGERELFYHLLYPMQMFWPVLPQILAERTYSNTTSTLETQLPSDSQFVRSHHTAVTKLISC